MAVKNLGQLTARTINDWPGRFDFKDDTYYCRHCAGVVMQATCFVSIHLKVFGSTCAGPGKVQQINYPFCPVCDGEIEHATACFHV